MLHADATLQFAYSSLNRFRIETIYFKMKDGSNILNKAAFDEIYDFDSKIRRDMEVKVDGEMWNFTDICAKVPAAYPARLYPPRCRADDLPTRQARPTDEFCLAGGSPLEFFYNISSNHIEMDAITSDQALRDAVNKSAPCSPTPLLSPPRQRCHRRRWAR